MGWRWLGLLLCLPLVTQAAVQTAQLAWRSDQGDQLLLFNSQQLLSEKPLPEQMSTALGSVWKLFVYAWLSDTGQQEPAYQCRGDSPEERYCCETGQSIQRDAALVKSCGLYFEPQRLQINPQQWREYWQTRQAPQWISELAQLQPATRVPVKELLTALQQLPAQQQARRVLLDVSLAADERRATAVLGGRLRVKTWSWHSADGAREGGFAGWLLDGTPVWMSGPGTSRLVLAKYAEVLAKTLPTPWPKDPQQCVEVALFQRYPIRDVLDAQGAAVREGRLQGRYQVRFGKGQLLDIQSQGDLYLLHTPQGPKLTARLDQEEYVARVLDREAAARPAEAAKALAVTIRTYLLQNAVPRGDCLSMLDSTQHQRVAPRPASAAARKIAAWSSDLILTGAAVTYHTEQAAVGKLSWREAVEQAGQGMTFDLILNRAFPYSELGRGEASQTHCQALTEAERWLHTQRRNWRQRLSEEIGYEEPGRFAVCRLGSGNPYTDYQRQRIYVRGLYSLQDRLDLAHEYLHLAFQLHPNGQDEAYVEGLARHLILE